MQDFLFFSGRNIERFRKIFGQLMIKCPARNRTMVFYFWFIVRRWEGNKILVIVSSKTPYNSLILIYMYLLLIAWCHVNKCHHIISSCYHLRSKYIACRYHTGILVCNIRIKQTYKHQCQGLYQAVFSDNLYLNEYVVYMYYLADRTSTPSYERLWQISTACWRNIHSTQQVDRMDRSEGPWCWWKNSCTSWYGKYPIVYRVLYIPSGVGFLPSTVCIHLHLHRYTFPIVVYKVLDLRLFDVNSWYTVVSCCFSLFGSRNKVVKKHGLHGSEHFFVSLAWFILSFKTLYRACIGSLSETWLFVDRPSRSQNADRIPRCR